MNMPFNPPVLMASMTDYRIIEDGINCHGEAILYFKQIFQTLIGECRNEVSLEVRYSWDDLEVLSAVIGYYNLPSQEWQESPDWDQALTVEQRGEFLNRPEVKDAIERFKYQVLADLEGMPKITGYVD